MARQVTVVRAFNGINRDAENAAQDDQSRYFTGGNSHELEEFVSEEEFQYRIDAGYIVVSEETPEAAIPRFVHPNTLEEQVEDVAQPISRRARKAKE